MDLPNPFKLERLTINAVDDGGTDRLGGDSFEAMFNPTQYTVTYRNNQEHQRTLNPLSHETKPAGQEPHTFTVKLLLDSTGVTGLAAMGNLFGMLTTSVQNRINQFLKLCFIVKDEKHRPNKIRVKWGAVNFTGFLESVSVNYSLFDQAGQPLRAELDCYFIADRAPVPSELKSPDLTHIRTVQSGDTLPLLAKAMYGSSRYYLVVAEANGLDDFRNLKPGTKLFFPPLEKT